MKTLTTLITILLLPLFAHANTLLPATGEGGTAQRGVREEGHASVLIAQADKLATKVALDIPAGELTEALKALSKQTGTDLVFRPEQVEGHKTPGLKGEYTPKDAVAKLLKGTPLRLTTNTAGAMLIAEPKPIATSLTRDDKRGEAITLAQADQAMQKVTTGDETKKDETSVESSKDRDSDSQDPESKATLREVVVTAQKREESQQNVPISITVLRGEDLDRSTVQGISESLNTVSGVATAETYLGSGTNIAIRGVGSTFPLFTGPSAVAYYLDSVPFGLVKSAIGPDADAYDLQRVEVLRGPQGTLYGSSALNGVVRVLTADPNLDAFSVKARLSGSGTSGGGDNYRANVTLNAPIVAGRLAARATVGYQHNAGWIDRPDEKDVNDTNITTYRLKVDGRPTDELSVGLFAWRYRSNSDAPNLGHTFDRNASTLDQPGATDYDAYGLKLGYDLPWFSISSMTSGLQYENVGRLGLDVPGFGIPGALYYSRLQSHITAEEINLTSSLEGSWRWSAGGMYRKGTEDLAQSFTVLPIPDIHYINKSESYALYGELTRLFFDRRLELTGGLRYFHDRLPQYGQTAPNTPFQYALSTAHANTPRALVTWHATNQLMFYTSYSRGFRSGFPQNPAVLQALPTFPAVKPDLLKNYEAGAKGTLLNGSISFDTAIYHMDWQDIQLLLATPINGVPYPGVVNGAQARGNGADVNVTFRIGRGFTLSPYLSWNDLAVTSDVLSGSDLLYRKGDRPSGSPRTTAGLAAGYEFALGSSRNTARISASANYISPLAYRSIVASGVPVLVQESDRILITRASVAVDFADQWTATLFGDNLTKEEGATAVMFPGVVPDWESRVRPLTVGLQVEYRVR